MCSVTPMSRSLYLRHIDDPRAGAIPAQHEPFEACLHTRTVSEPQIDSPVACPAHASPLMRAGDPSLLLVAWLHPLLALRLESSFESRGDVNSGDPLCCVDLARRLAPHARQPPPRAQQDGRQLPSVRPPIPAECAGRGGEETSDQSERRASEAHATLWSRDASILLAFPVSCIRRRVRT